MIGNERNKPDLKLEDFLFFWELSGQICQGKLLENWNGNFIREQA
jgi:hypothetical protein